VVLVVPCRQQGCRIRKHAEVKNQMEEKT
jgi:hypothetical protein